MQTFVDTQHHSMQVLCTTVNATVFACAQLLVCDVSPRGMLSSSHMAWEGG